VSASPFLRVCDVSVTFDGVRALDHLTLAIDEGELRCIIGPNGAGKTTLMDVVTGKTRPTGGRVLFGADPARDLTSLAPHRIARLGVGRKFQRPTVFPGHSVCENLELSVSAREGLVRTLLRRLGPDERAVVDAILVQVGLEDRANVRAETLSHGEKQWLEIGMLLAQRPKLLLVDEPVAGMTQAETERTAALLSSLAGAHTVVVVEHDMEFVRSIARRVTVLHEGRVLAEGTLAEVQADARVVEVYLGS